MKKACRKSDRKLSELGTLSSDTIPSCSELTQNKNTIII